jgi:hypothetical protein
MQQIGATKSEQSVAVRSIDYSIVERVMRSSFV